MNSLFIFVFVGKVLLNLRSYPVDQPAIQNDELERLVVGIYKISDNFKIFFSTI